jgi:hypothetical protein
MNFSDFLSPQLLGGSVAALAINAILCKLFPKEEKLSTVKYNIRLPSNYSGVENTQGVQILCVNSGKTNIENREVVVWTKSGEIIDSQLSLPSVEEWELHLDSSRKRITFRIGCLKPKEGFSITLSTTNSSLEEIEIDSRSVLKVTDGSARGIDFKSHLKIFRIVLASSSLIQGLLILNSAASAAGQIEAHPKAFYVVLGLFVYGSICYLSGATIMFFEIPWQAIKEALREESHTRLNKR